MLRLVPSLLIPAASLAFVGLVQGAAISAGFPNPDGRYPDASRDFIGQGAANVIAGIFRGMAVGGSMSATTLNRAAGARSRIALMMASMVMAVVIIAFAGLVGHIPLQYAVLVGVGLSVILQDRVTGVTGLISPQDIYAGDERVGATLKRAYADATAWIEHNQPATGTDAR